ncbi:MAG: hypothetical protein QNL04_10635 [SAR324 cluster bacterium]|nr:hypothetical protein [SAR324 cluster bacterium]
MNEEITLTNLESPETSIVTQNDTEKYILEIFHEEDFQSRIKTHLKEAVTKELASLSQLLKDSIRDWVQREKNKMVPQTDPKQIEMAGKLEELESENRMLAMDNDSMARKIELKDHENKMLFDSLQATLTRK